MTNLLSKINLSALKSGAKDIGENIDNLPDEITTNNEIDSNTLQKLHYLLFDIHIIDGSLICPESGRRFPIKDSIPNMLLHEDEI
eukprot:gene20939-27140_t